MEAEWVCLPNICRVGETEMVAKLSFLHSLVGSSCGSILRGWARSEYTVWKRRICHHSPLPFLANAFSATPCSAVACLAIYFVVQYVPLKCNYAWRRGKKERKKTYSKQIFTSLVSNCVSPFLIASSSKFDDSIAKGPAGISLWTHFLCTSLAYPHSLPAWSAHLSPSPGLTLLGGCCGKSADVNGSFSSFSFLPSR